MANEHLHDDRDVEQILKLAVNKAGYSDQEALRQRLMTAAAELGLSEAQVQAAEEEYAAQKVLDAEKAEYHQFVTREFWEHFCSYLIVNAGLIGFNVYSKGHISWAVWPLLGWGIGIAFHAVSTFAKNSESYRSEFEKWRSGRRRRRSRSKGLTIGVTLDSPAPPAKRAAKAELDEG